MRECPQCHHLNENDARVCETCQTPLRRNRPFRWLLGRINPDAMHGLVAVGRGLGWTLIILAFVVFFWTPPPRMWDDAILLGLGGSLLILVEALKPYEAPPGAIEIIPPDDPGETEA